jgi:hypothetical protein
MMGNDGTSNVVHKQFWLGVLRFLSLINVVLGGFLNVSFIRDRGSRIHQKQG